MIPYTIITSKNKWWKKVIYFICVLFALSLIFIIYLSLVTGIGNQSISIVELLCAVLTNRLIWWYSLACAGLIFLIGTVAGILSIYFKKADSRKQTSSQPQKRHAPINMPKSVFAIFIAIICIAIYALLFYWIGHSYARELREYKVIDNNQVVLYEGEKIFLVAQCQISGAENEQILLIDKGVQTVLDKNDRTTRTIEFYKIHFQSLTS